MRVALRGGALAAVLLVTAAQAQDSPAALVEQFALGFSTGDPVVMAALFTPDATFLGPTEPDLIRGSDGAREYFARAWLPGVQRRLTCDVLNTRQLSADAAMVEAWCRGEATAPDGSRGTGELRLSALAVRDNQGPWLFSSLHASAPPRR